MCHRSLLLPAEAGHVALVVSLNLILYAAPGSQHPPEAERPALRIVPGNFLHDGFHFARHFLSRKRGNPRQGIFVNRDSLRRALGIFLAEQGFDVCQNSSVALFHLSGEFVQPRGYMLMDRLHFKRNGGQPI